jgi:hypothetical protein
MFGTQASTYHPTVGRWRQTHRAATWNGWSNGTIARHCGVATSFVGKLRRSLDSESSEERQYLTSTALCLPWTPRVSATRRPDLQWLS